MNGIIQTFKDASEPDAWPVTLTLSNGRTLTGVPYYVDDEETVCISTGYKHDDPGVWVDPDKPPTHVAVAHVVSVALGRRMSARAVLTCPEGSPDYVECSCRNDPISSRGFYICEADGTPYDGPEYRPLIRCEDCGAMFDGAEIAAEGIAGATFQAVGMARHHVTRAVGDSGGGWRVVCTCGWDSRTYHRLRQEACAVGDRHLRAGNGQVPA